MANLDVLLLHMVPNQRPVKELGGGGGVVLRRRESEFGHCAAVMLARNFFFVDRDVVGPCVDAPRPSRVPVNFN